MTERHVVKYLAELALACWQKRAHCPKVPLRTSLHIVRNCRAPTNVACTQFKGRSHTPMTWLLLLLCGYLR